MSITQKTNLIVVTGPTASGKTAFAAQLALPLNGEIISADSRQVYRGMDKATGKDFKDYIVGGKHIPYYLVDIVDPGYEYNVFEFQKDFIAAFGAIHNNGSLPILCGGTGLYIESVLKGYKLIDVKENKELRESLNKKTDAELVEKLKSYKTPHNLTDIRDRKRLMRAVEIQQYNAEHPEMDFSFPEIHPVIFGIHFDRATLRKRITDRLDARLNSGMVEEVRALLRKGMTPEQLKFYGLEYKYLTQFVIGEICYNDMFNLLNTAIHQFAKRQMTWFRKMEREGSTIHWIDGALSMDLKIERALEILK
jgi:tRNA dimethylallyltransferase